MKRTILAATALAALLTQQTVFAAEPTTDSLTKSKDISGQYNCSGHDPFTPTDYTGKLVITKTGSTYNFAWDLGKNTLYHGTGVVSSKADDVAAVWFVNSANPAETGVQLFRVNDDASLSGNWTLSGKDKLGIEVCNRVK